MAGGKETPRQKLINLMYLVLLAMLALQVSSAIIQKFYFLNESLTHAVEESELRNLEILSNIQIAVENNKNIAADVAVLDAAKKVRKSTTTQLKQIRKLKKELIDASGGKDEQGFPKGAKDEETVAQMMLGVGDSKNGAAYTLKIQLDAFIKEMNSSMEQMKESKRFNNIALDAKQDPIFKDDKEQRRKDFAHVNFESTPLIAALAVLSEKEAQITTIESDVLNHLAKKVGVARINVDRLRPVVLSEANKVVAGTKFKGEMFMAAYHSTYQPEMTFQNSPIKVNNKGVADIEFSASGGNYGADGMLKKTWKGTIKYPKPTGGDSIYDVSYDYYVVKPQILVQGEEVDVIYRNCGNKLNFSVPALGAAYNPKFSVDGGQIKNTNNRGEIIVIPNQPRTTISISNESVFIGAKKFKVKSVPKPTISLTNNGQPYKVDVIKGMKPNYLHNISVKAFADKAFAKTNPKDARFKIKKFRVSIIRGVRDVYNEPFTAQGKRLTNFARKAQAGDRIVVTVTEVIRKNYLGEIEVVNMPGEIFSIPIN